MPAPARKVTKAVIPAAGLGTRFLPASKAQPKEMMPIVDKPAIQYVVEEAVREGIDNILIVTGRGKSSIEDHFDRSLELEVELERRGKLDLLKQMQQISDLADVHSIRQGDPLGLGHAVLMARQHVDNDPFVVMLPDDLIHDTVPVLRGMIDAYQRHGHSVVAFKEVSDTEISSYGCALAEPVEENLIRVVDIVEKPSPEEAPSRLAVMGRYLFTPAIFDALGDVHPGKGGEIQLTDAIRLLLEREPVYGYTFEHGRYDAGNKLDYLRATVELALEREDLGPPFRAYLTELLQGE